MASSLHVTPEQAIRSALLMTCALFGNPVLAQDAHSRATAVLGSPAIEPRAMAYLECMWLSANELFIAGHRSSKTVDAAEAKCAHDLSEYEDAFREQLLSLNQNTGLSSSTATAEAKTAAAWFRSTVREEIVKLVLQAESKK